MIYIIICILSVAVAVLSAFCFWQSHIIEWKNKVLVEFISENVDLNNRIMELENELYSIKRKKL